MYRFTLAYTATWNYFISPETIKSNGKDKRLFRIINMIIPSLLFDININIFNQNFIDNISKYNLNGEIIFEGIKKSFSNQFNNVLIKDWHIKDELFMLKHYVNNYSLKYLSKNGWDLYYLTIVINTEKEVENINICEPQILRYQGIEYNEQYTSNPISIVKKELKTKNQFIVKINKIIIPNNVFIKIFDSLKHLCLNQCCNNNLQEYKSDNWWITFECKICGKQYVCECFKDSINAYIEELSTEKNYIEDSCGKDNYKNALKFCKSLCDIEYKEGVCHLCIKRIPKYEYNFSGFSSFKQKYYPYIENTAIHMGKYCNNVYSSLETIKENEKIDRESENIIRELLQYPKIGEKWINETFLYNIIKILFSDYEIIREASPKWLDRQRFDIFIPNLNLAIEYQGEQHFKAVSRFGGEEGLKKAKERDKLKYKLAKKNNISIIYFKYNEILTEESVKRKLKQFL